MLLWQGAMSVLWMCVDLCVHVHVHGTDHRLREWCFYFTFHQSIHLCQTYAQMHDGIMGVKQERHRGANKCDAPRTMPTLLTKEVSHAAAFLNCGMVFCRSFVSTTGHPKLSWASDVDGAVAQIHLGRTNAEAR